jgi:L-fucose mutarotase/ribose pyranase (RbsD/FucU family)
MDMDVFRAMADMGHSDKLVYLDLVRRAYGAFPKAKNICSCTYYEISETSGIKARDAISASVQWLEDNSYIKRLLISRQRGIKSLYRVFLPCEIPGRESRTKLTFNDDGIR